MEAVTHEAENVTEAGRSEKSPAGEPEGLRPARAGLQPVRDLGAFLQSLPDFGEEAQRLLDAVMENRSQRRREAEERGC